MMGDIFNDDHLWTFVDTTASDNVDLEGQSYSYTLPESIFSDPGFYSCDTDFDSNTLFMYDYYTSSIYRMNNFTSKMDKGPDISFEVFHQGVTGTTARGRVAVDWKSHNVYFVDYAHRWIAMQPVGTNDQSMWALIVYNNTISPSDISLDPEKNVIFWVDIGNPERIQRATLTGQRIKTIVHKNLGRVTALHVDVTEERVYWISYYRDNVESCDYNGFKRSRFIKTSVSFSNDLVIIGNDVILVLNDGIEQYDKTTKLKGTESTSLFDSYLSVCVWDPAKTSANTACSSKGCAHMCVDEGSSGATCVCKDGYKLGTDGKSCIVDTGIHSKGLAYTNGTHLCIMDIRLFTHAGFAPECFFQAPAKVFKPNATDNIVQFVPDTHNRQYFVALESGKIITVSYSGVMTNLNDSTGGFVTGLALDWNDRYLYWSENVTGSIWVRSLATTKAERFITTSTDPREVVVMPHEQKLAWISSTSSGLSKIEIVNLNGQNKATLVDNIVDAKSLGYHRDTARLYYIAQPYLSVTTLDGTSSNYINLFANTGLAILYKSFAIEIADDSDSYYAFHTTFSYSDVNASFAIEGQITKARVVDNQEEPLEIGACSLSNGGCEHICLPDGTNRICACESGFDLASDGLNCESNPVTDNFTLVIDSTHGDIYQIDLANQSSVQGIDTKATLYPKGVAFSKHTSSVVWGGYKSTLDGMIVSTGLYGQHEQILVESVDSIGRLKIDQSSGTIFYLADGGYETSIMAVNADGDTLTIIGGLSHPTDLVIDPKEGFIFWLDDWDERVTRCNMDGSEEISLFESTDDGIWFPEGMAIDYDSKVIYWSDPIFGTIEKCNYDGGNREEIYNNFFLSIQDIAIDQGYLYFISDRPYITKINLKNVSQSSSFGTNTEFGRLTDMYFYRSEALRTHPLCSVNNGGCAKEQFCLPRANVNNMPQRTCVCPDFSDKVCDRVSGGKGLIATMDNYISPEHEFETFVQTDEETYLMLDARKSYKYDLGDEGFRYPPNIFTCDSDFAHNFLFFHDYQTNALFRLSNFTINFERQMNLSLFHPGMIGDRDSSKISVDWQSQNVYFSDYGHQSISMQPVATNDPSMYKRVVQTKNPSEIAVDPKAGFIFWIEESRKDKDTGGEAAHIMRSSLLGENIMTLLYNSLGDADGLTLDTKRRKIYWIGISSSTIERCDYNGSNRETFLKDLLVVYIDLVVLEDNLVALTDPFFSAALDVKHLHVFNITSKQKLSEYSSPDDFFSICSWNENFKPDGQDPCKSHGCEHMCVNQAGATCVCKEGYVLDTDGKKCKEDLGIFHKAVIVSNGTNLCRMDVRMFSHDSYTPNCFYHVNNSEPITIKAEEAWIISFAVDANEGYIYVAKKSGKIVSFPYNDPTHEEVVKDNAGVITAIAWSWIGNLLYWSDNSTGSIWELNVQSKQAIKRVTAISNPQNLIVLPHQSKLLWLSGIGNSKIIEMSNLDGSDRHAFVAAADLGNPFSFGYWADKHRLYWMDNSRTLKTAPYSPTVNGSLIKDEKITSYDVLGAKFYKNFLLYGIYDDDEKLTVYRVYTGEGNKIGAVTMSRGNFTGMGMVLDIQVMDPSDQTAEQDACINNGGCQHICTPKDDGKARDCQCLFAFKLQDDGTSCATSPVDDEFMLLVDRTSNEIYQVNMKDDSVQAIPLPPNADPYGAVYHPSTRSVIYSSWDEYEIKTAYLDGQGGETLLQLGFLVYPYRIAIDYTTDSIFFIQYDDYFFYYLTSIMVCNFAGDKRPILEDMGDPEDLAIDSKMGLIFYTDSSTSNAHVGKIDMYGDKNSLRNLVTGIIGYPHGLAVDTEEQRIYWSDSIQESERMLMSSDYNGNTRKTVVSGKGQYALDIAIDERYIYYVALQQEYVTRISKANFKDKSQISKHIEMGLLYTLTIFNSTADKGKRNVFCGDARGNCSSFCLPINNTYGICACDGNVDVDANNTNECQNVITCPSRIGSSSVVSTCLRRHEETCDVLCDQKTKQIDTFDGATCHNGTWNIQEPCEAILCDTTLDDGGGFVTIEPSCDRKVDSTCGYTCPFGFKLTRDISLTCNLNPQNKFEGNWQKSGTGKLCERILCPVNITNGNVSTSCNRYIGNLCGFTCSSGYIVNTNLDSTIRCIISTTNIEMGMWNTSDSKTECILAPLPPVVEKQAGLSDGAAAGIGIGVALIVLVVIIVLVYFFMQRNRKKMSFDDKENLPQYQQFDAPMAPDGPGFSNPVQSDASAGYAEIAADKSPYDNMAVSYSKNGELAEKAEIAMPGADGGARTQNDYSNVKF